MKGGKCDLDFLFSMYYLIIGIAFILVSLDISNVILQFGSIGLGLLFLWASLTILLTTSTPPNYMD